MLEEAESPASPSSPGVVYANAMYTLSEVKRRLGINDAALRTARRNGLRVFYAHKHGYVLGNDLIDYILKIGGQQSEGRRAS